VDVEVSRGAVCVTSGVEEVVSSNPSEKGSVEMGSVATGRAWSGEAVSGATAREAPS